MKSTRLAGLTSLFLALLALHYWLRPLLAWRAGIDFLLIGVLLVSVRLRPGAAAFVGCVAGIVADAMAPSAFGATTLAMTLVACAASWLKSSFFAENIALNAIFLFAGKVAFDAAFLVFEGRLDTLALLSQLVVWSTLGGITTAIAGVLALLLFRPLLASPRES